MSSCAISCADGCVGNSAGFLIFLFCCVPVYVVLVVFVVTIYTFFYVPFATTKVAAKLLAFSSNMVDRAIRQSSRL